jgi:SSS family solute:Na+ symporter
MNTGLAILLVLLAALLVMAWRVSLEDKKNIRDFATASGGLGVFLLTLTLSATYHSAYAFLGAGGFVYTHGIGWWCNGLWTVLPGVMFWIWGRRFWFLGRKYGYLSVAEYVSDVYQSHWLGLLVTAICMIFTVPYVAMQAIGSGYIFNAISAGTLSYATGTLIFLGVMIILVWLGGMKGVAVTDAAQGVFMWVGLVFGSYWILTTNFGSIAGAYEAAAKSMPALFTLPGPKGLVTSADWVSRWIVINIGMMMFPHITLRFFSGRSLDVLKWSSVFSSIYLTSIYFFTPGIGMTGHILLPGLKAADTVFPEMLLKFTPTVFASLVIAGALAAAMSTGDSQLHAVSSMVSTDVYKRFVEPNASERKLYHVAKISIVIFGVISVIFALQKPALLGNILAFSTGGVAALAPTILGGIYWRRSSKTAAFASIVLGEAAMFTTTFAPGFKNFLGVMPGMWAIIVSVATFVAMSLLATPSVHTKAVIDSIDAFFDVRSAADR